MVQQAMTLQDWEELASSEKQVFSEALLDVLPAGFTFHRLYIFERGGQRHELAVYFWRGLSFIFIPGGRVRLGFDLDIASLPVSMRTDFEEETHEEMEQSFEEFIAGSLTSVRECEIPSLLVQTFPYLLGQPRSNRFPGGDQTLSHAFIASLVAEEGFRLPFSDEWEYLCAGGSKSLFYWGNSYSVPKYPYDDYWNLTHFPNAFGLQIAFDPTSIECCQEANTCRGGDGGGALDSGVGRFAEWLPLSSWYSPIVGYSHFRNAYFRRILQIS